jgi:hypothetical protein
VKASAHWRDSSGTRSGDWTGTAMAELDIAADEKLLRVVQKLATELYGDGSEASRKRVVETALEMRILWTHSVEKNRSETEEAVSKWEFKESSTEVDSGPVRNWLFRR